MKNYGIVRSTIKPDPIKVDEFSVWKSNNIHQISENVGEEMEFDGYEYEMIQYDKDEYILMLESDMYTTQEALIEIAGILGGGDNG